VPDIHDLVQADVQSLRPTTRPALAGLRARARRRQQRHWTVAAVSAAAAVFVIVALTVGGPRQAAPPAGDTQPVKTVPGQSLLSYRGVQIPVPTAWTKGSRACGTPMRDIAYVEGNGILPACLVINEHSGDLTEVRLWGTLRGLKPGRSVIKDGRTQIVRFFTDRGTSLTATSPNAQLAQDYVDAAVALPGAARIDGCLVYDPAKRPKPAPQQNGRLVPQGQVTAGSACGYNNGWLDYSVALSRRQSTNLAASFAGAPVTTDLFPTVNPGRCATSTVESGLTYKLSFTVDGKQSRLWIYTNNCRQAAVINDRGLTASGPWSLVSHVFSLMSPTFQIDVSTG